MPENNDNSQPYTTEAVIDLIFARLFNRMEFLVEEHHLNDFDLIKRILSYIENNFKEDISRNSIAKKLGYTESHISRTFHKYIGHSIPHHVNLLRIDYIDRQRKKFKNKNIIDLIMDSGFKSVQSYYRNKKTVSLAPNVGDN
jgi:methylphosphotriester-DNA--protein-cysteine methyltransferase